MTWAYFGRLLFVTAAVNVVLGPLRVLVPVGLMERWGDERLWHFLRLGSDLLADFAFAFAVAVPALAYTTRLASRGIELGARTLRRTWPGSSWYLLAVALAGPVAPRLLQPAASTTAARVFVVVLTDLARLLAAGAIAVLYLRHHEVGEDGAARMPRRAPADLAHIERRSTVYTVSLLILVTFLAGSFTVRWLSTRRDSRAFELAGSQRAYALILRGSDAKGTDGAALCHRGLAEAIEARNRKLARAGRECLDATDVEAEGRYLDASLAYDRVHRALDRWAEGTVTSRSLERNS